MRRLAATLTRVVAAAAVLGACSSGPSHDEPATAGPLTDYTSEFAARVLAQAERERVAGAEAVAACMHAQGFDHAPFVDAWSVTTATVPPERSTAQWAQEHGYGLVDGSASGPDLEGATDPNADLVAEMSAAERTAYLLALHGPPDAPQDGCLARAPDPADAWSDETYLHHVEEAARLEEDARAAAAVVTARDAWRTCMADEGVPGYDSPDAAVRDVTERVQEAERNGPGTVPEPTRTGLLELERTVATASRRCEDVSELPRRLAAAVRDAQVAYVEEHRAELDAWALTWPDPTSTGTTGG
ncbi:hypothetical protein LJN51_01050 [Cellulomonas sp. zg-B12]|nr:hypothetical protein [Cellulomonas xiejunii]